MNHLARTRYGDIYTFQRSTLIGVQLSQKVAKIEKVSIEDLALDFTIPGYDIELRVRFLLCFVTRDLKQMPYSPTVPIFLSPQKMSTNMWLKFWMLSSERVLLSK